MENKYFEIDHRLAREFNSYVATGAWGGFNGNGLISLNFHRDKMANASKTRVPVIEKYAGVFAPNGPEEVVEKSGDIIRETCVEVLMSIEDVKGLRDWLSDQIATAENLMGVTNAK